MKPAISIIVPVHNIEPYLSGCLDSILSQTFINFEVILINDGSTDNSGTICRQYAEIDTRVKVINKNYGGVSTARNAGLNLAQGEFIGFVDGDDYIEKNMYQELYNLCKNTKSDISICKLGREVNGNIINKGQDPFIKEMDNTEAMRELFKGVLYRFSLCNKLFKKKCFENIEFPDGRIHEDLSTTYRLFAKADKAIYTNNIGYIYVNRENSTLTSMYHEKRLDAFIGWEEILSFMKMEYPMLSKEFISCFVFGCIDNVYYILNQVKIKKDQEKYLVRIQQFVRNNYKEILQNQHITLKNKYLLSMLIFNVKSFLLFNNIKGLWKTFKYM